MQFMRLPRQKAEMFGSFHKVFGFGKETAVEMQDLIGPNDKVTRSKGAHNQSLGPRQRRRDLGSAGLFSEKRRLDRPFIYFGVNRFKW
jgi:hypothetical protein